MWPVYFDEKNNKTYDMASRLLKDRIIFVAEEINSETAASIICQLLILESENSTAPITMIINSPGGTVSDGLAIYDTMNKISCPITTICNGMAASMGAFLLCSGSKGRRMAMPNSTIMIHQPLGDAHGQATEIQIAAERILKLRKQLYQIMADNCGQSFKTIERACERDNYLTAQEALKMGLIDSIIETPKKAQQTLKEN